MRAPPGLNQLPRYPVVGGVGLLALVVSVARFLGHDVSFLYEGPLIARGQLWRFVTSALPHADVIHLAFNLYWLWVFGTLIEEVFGHARTLALIVLLAAGSGAAEYAVLAGGIGLSGVGYGLFGMLWVLSRRDARFHDAVDSQTIGLFVGWFFLCIALTVTGTWAVANIAHGAGAVLGALLGLAITERRASPARVGSWAALALSLSASLAGGTVVRPWVNIDSHRGDDEARLAYARLDAGNNEESIRWYRAAIALNPREANWWYHMGVAYSNQKRLSDALDCFERAHALVPGDQRAVDGINYVRNALAPAATAP